MKGLWMGLAVGGLILAGGAGPGTGAGGFRDVAPEAGLNFQHYNDASSEYHLPEIMGAGGALLDFDGDGDLDALLLQGRPLVEHTAKQDVTLGPRLFRNDLAPGVPAAGLHFTDVTERSGLVPGDYGMGVAVGDYDGDGRPDLYITNYGPNRLYRNSGRGTFADVTVSAGSGLDDPRWSTSATFTDYDGDGDLDLFVANYVDFSVAGSKKCYDPAGVRDYCGPRQFRPVPDRLFRNNGDGTFTDVSETSGITRAAGPGLGVVGADFNGDRRCDFYVANDGGANQLWLNQGDGRFEDGALMAGAAFTMDGQAEGSMGIASGDPDNDGDLDLVVTNITGEGAAFYENLGHGQFEDRRIARGLGAATRPYTGFGTDWFDYDNDGSMDLFVANGAVTILEALGGERFRFRQRNQLLRNVGGLRFRDVTDGAGPGLQLSDVSRGAAFGDVDNDGDVDILVTNNGGPARLLLNELPPASHWLEVRLQGTTDNRDGLGARVGLLMTGGRTLWRRAHTDGSYLSASEPRVHFGLADAASVDAVVVEWPRGGLETWSVADVNRIVSLRQGSGRAIRDGMAGRHSERHY